MLPTSNVGVPSLVESNGVLVVGVDGFVYQPTGRIQRIELFGRLSGCNKRNRMAGKKCQRSNKSIHCQLPGDKRNRSLSVAVSSLLGGRVRDQRAARASVLDEKARSIRKMEDGPGRHHKANPRLYPFWAIRMAKSV